MSKEMRVGFGLENEGYMPIIAEIKKTAKALCLEIKKWDGESDITPRVRELREQYVKLLNPLVAYTLCDIAQTNLADNDGKFYTVSKDVIDLCSRVAGDDVNKRVMGDVNKIIMHTQLHEKE